MVMINEQVARPKTSTTVQAAARWRPAFSWDRSPTATLVVHGHRTPVSRMLSGDPDAFNGRQRQPDGE